MTAARNTTQISHPPCLQRKECQVSTAWADPRLSLCDPAQLTSCTVPRVIYGGHTNPHTNPEAPYKQATPATPATALHGSKAGVALPPWQSCKQLHGREPWEGCWKLPCLLPAFWSNSLICFLILLIRCFMCLTCVDPHSHMDGPLLADWHQAWIRTKAKQGAKLRMHKCTWSYIRKPVIHTHGSLCSPPLRVVPPAAVTPPAAVPAAVPTVAVTPAVLVAKLPRPDRERIVKTGCLKKVCTHLSSVKSKARPVLHQCHRWSHGPRC